MESVQIRLTHQLLRRVDNLVKKGIYSNRNETIRDAVRKLTLEYDTLMYTGRLRAKLTPKLLKKSGEKLIREVREEEDRL